MQSDKVDIFIFGKLIRGDKTALEILYRKYYGLMLNYGMKLCQNKEIVQDCIQDVYIKIFNNKNVRCDNLPSPRSYLLVALRNTLYDVLSKKLKMDSIEEMDFSVYEEDDRLADFFEGDDEQLAKVSAILQYIYGLGAKNKMALYLKFIKGFSHKEIASVLGMKEQSSMNLISRTIIAIREKIDEQK